MYLIILHDGLLSIGTISEQNKYIFFKIILVSYSTLLYRILAVKGSDCSHYLLLAEHNFVRG